jgi:periplasmic mercuric ion binding protein
MNRLPAIAISAALILLPRLALAGEVKVTGVHLCCKACVKAAEEALDVDGVTDFSVDRESRTIVIVTDDAEAALAALTNAGFYGRIAGRPEPESPAIKDESAAKSFQLTRTHLCCGQCQKAIVAAIRSVPNVETVEIEDEVLTVTANRDGVRPSKVLDAIHKAGFHAQVEQVKP